MLSSMTLLARYARGVKEGLTYSPLIQAHPQCLQSVDEALLEVHGLVPEAADVVLVQGQHGHALADAPCQLRHQCTTCQRPQY